MSAGKQKFFIVILPLSCFFIFNSLAAQFHPAPPNNNSNAIFKDDAVISFWADSVQVFRSWQNIADTSLGKASVGTQVNVLGKANNVFVSLGDGGSAIVYFPFPIYNESGYDFAIFENSFAEENAAENILFNEYAIVQVSDDNVNYIAFESTSNIDTINQVGSFESTDCSLVNNLAGKYPLNYGTPFDLDELGLDSILSIKIIDVIGSINPLYSMYDSQGNKINDPFPTPYPSSGFDLNAIAALNQKNQILDTTINAISNQNSLDIEIYPNPIKSGKLLQINSHNSSNKTIKVFDINGRLVYNQKIYKSSNIETINWSKGLYILQIYDKKSFFSSKFIIE